MTRFDARKMARVLTSLTAAVCFFSLFILYVPTTWQYYFSMAVLLVGGLVWMVRLLRRRPGGDA